MVEKKNILKKKLIINLVFIIFISIIFFVFYLNNNSQKEDGKSYEKLFDLSEIQEVYFSRDSFEMLAKKTNNSWAINAPINARMSLDILEKINYLNDFNSFEIVNINKNSIFANAKASFTVKIDDLVFEFGILNSVVNKQYLLFDGQVYLVPTFFSNNFSDDIFTYIEKTIIPSKLEIKTIEFPNWTYHENSIYNKLDSSKKYTLPSDWKKLWTSTLSSEISVDKIKFESFITFLDFKGNKYKLFFKETKNSFMFRFQNENYIYKLGKESTLRLIEPWIFLNARAS